MRDNWISVKKELPPCKRGFVLGTPVLVWPRSCGTDGFCYFGRRASTQPNFYLHGAVIHGVTHWMPMPKGPSK